MYNKQFASSRQAANTTKLFSTKSNLLGKIQFVPMKIPAHFKRWEETLMNVIHGTVDLGSSLSNNINSEEKDKRHSQQSQVRTNEPTNSQNNPIGEDIVIFRATPLTRKTSLEISRVLLWKKGSTTIIEKKELQRMSRKCQDRKFISYKEKLAKSKRILGFLDGR